METLGFFNLLVFIRFYLALKDWNPKELNLSFSNARGGACLLQSWLRGGSLAADLAWLRCDQHSVGSHPAAAPPSFPASLQEREQLRDCSLMNCGGMCLVSLECERNLRWVVSIEILNYFGRLCEVSSQGSYLHVNQQAQKKREKNVSGRTFRKRTR